MPKARAIPAIETRDAIGVDVNYREVVVVRSLEDSVRLPTRIEDAAHVRRHAEALQRRRGRSWKGRNKILTRLRRLRRRFRNILLDAARKIGKAVAEYALAKKAEIWMEDLSGPKKRAQEASEDWRLRLTFLAYRRTVLDSPPSEEEGSTAKGTSSRCPADGFELVEAGRRTVCRPK